MSAISATILDRMWNLDQGSLVIGGGALLVAALLIGYAVGWKRKERVLEHALTSAREVAATRTNLGAYRQRALQPSTIEPTVRPPRRVLVLGAFQLSRQVDAWPWDRVPSDMNVADYDVVIVNLIPLLDTTYAGNLQLDRIPEPIQFSRLVFSEQTELVFLGEPWVRIGGGAARTPYREIVSYLPHFPEYVEETSQAIDIVDLDFAYYFDGTTEVRYHFENYLGGGGWRESYLEYYLRPIHHLANSVAVKFKPIARTRFGKNVAVKMTFVAQYQEPRPTLTHQHMYPLKEPVFIKESSPVYWLPSTTGITSDEAIRRLLQERYGIHLEAVVPDWVGQFKTPAMKVLERDIDAALREARDIEVRVIVAQEKLKANAKFTELLYEQGDPLENVVREALRVLGAQVSEPERRGHEDGRLVDPYGRQAILEIKGVRGCLKIDHLRALHQWVGDAVAHERWTGRGMLIANTFCSSTIEQRGEMHPNDDFLATLRSYGFVMINTVDIFEAICRHQVGTLDLNGFWDSIFQATERWRPLWGSASNQ